MVHTTSEGTKLVDASGKNMDIIAGGGGYGWAEQWGQEVIHQYIMPRVNSSDIVLDLGSGDGRASNVFSMRNIPVIAVDLNRKFLEEGREDREKAGIQKVTEIIDDVRLLKKETIGKDPTIIIASDTVIHFTKSESDNFVKGLPKLLDPNVRGLIYINAPSTDSMTFKNPEYYGATRVDARTLRVMCDCSGTFKEEPLPFYAKGELDAILASLGGNILTTKELERNGSGLLHELVVEFGPKKSTQ